MFIVLIGNILVGNDYSGLKTIPIYLLNLQGISFVILKWQIPSIPALGPLWFLTVIMMNYVLLVIVKKIEKEEWWSNTRKVKVCYMTVVIVSSILAMFNIQLFYFVVYFIGYFLGKVKVDIDSKKYFWMSGLMVIAMATRLVARSKIDGTILYNNVVVMITHIVLAIWIFISINFVYEKAKAIFDKICEMKWWKYLESHSMMIYMTHYIFLVGTFNVNKLNVSSALELFVFVICTFISASALQFFTKKLQKII